MIARRRFLSLSMLGAAASALPALTTCAAASFWLYYVYLTSPNTLARVKVTLEP